MKNAFNLLDGYNILNSVKPKEEQTKFPYNSITNQHDITFTKNKIEILAKKVDDFVKSKIGGGKKSVITIYY